MNSLYKYNITTFTDINIQDITTVDIQLCINARVNDSSDDKISRLLGVWKRLFRTALIMQIVEKDPTLSIVIPKSKLPQVKRNVMTSKSILDDTLHALRMHTSKTDRHIFNTEIIIFALQVIYYTGLRPSECYALSRSDINLKTAS